MPKCKKCNADIDETDVNWNDGYCESCAQNVSTNSICKRCPIRVTCGGGYMPHRFSKENGFNNPSVYCRDLLKLICHVQNKVVDALGKSQFSDIQLDKINYKETLNYLYN